MADSGERLELKVKALPNDTYDVEAPPQWTVGDLKKLLEEKTGMPENRQRLIYRGRVLQNEVTLRESGLESGHTLHLVERNPDAPPQQQQTTEPAPQMTETTRISVNVGTAAPRDLQDISRIIQSVLGAVTGRPVGSNAPSQAPTGGGQQGTGSREAVPHLVMSLGNYLSRLEGGGLQSRMMPLISLGPRTQGRSATTRDCRAMTASIVQVLQEAPLIPELQQLLQRAVAEFSEVEDEAGSMTTVPLTAAPVEQQTHTSGQSGAAYPHLPLLVAAFSDIVRRAENLLKDKLTRSFSNAIRQLENTIQIDETNLEIIIGGMRQVGSIANWYSALLAEISRFAAGAISALRGDMYPLALNTASVVTTNGEFPSLPPLLPQGPRDSRPEGGAGSGSVNLGQMFRDSLNQPSQSGGDAPPEATPVTLSVEQSTGPIIEQLTMALIGNGGAILEGIGSALRGTNQEPRQPSQPAPAVAPEDPPQTQQTTSEAAAPPPLQTETTAPQPFPPSTSAASTSGPGGQSSEGSAPAGLRAGLGARPRSQGASSKRASTDAPGQVKSEKAAKTTGTATTTTTAATTTATAQTTSTASPAPNSEGMGGLLNSVAALVGGGSGGGGGGLESMVTNIASNLANNPNIRRMAENPAIQDLVSNVTSGSQTGEAPNIARLMGEMAPLMSSLLGNPQSQQQQQQQQPTQPRPAPTDLNLPDLSADRAAVWRRVFQEDARRMETDSTPEAILSAPYLAGRVIHSSSSQGLFSLGDDSDVE